MLPHVILLLLVRLATWNIWPYVDLSYGGLPLFHFMIALSLTEIVLEYLTHHNSHHFKSGPL